MEFEELRQQWQGLERKLDRVAALEGELLHRAIVVPARRRVNRLAVWPAVDLVVCLVVLNAGGLFLSGHWRDARLTAPALCVMAAAAALMASSVWMLGRVAGVDWSGPVAEIQGALERLRASRIRQFKWVMLLSPLVAWCGLVVGVHWGFEAASGGRVSVIDKMHGGWVVVNYLFGIAFVPVGYLAARVLAEKCRGRRWLHSLLDDISGRSLRTATEDVARWSSLRGGE